MRRVLWECWTRCGMGFISSPYTAMQATLHAKEVIRGDPNNPTNVFRWTDVTLNLPGSCSYKPCNPWVYKYRVLDDSAVQVIANGLRIYVDDARMTAQTNEERRQAPRVVASIASYLGIQDAPRKGETPAVPQVLGQDP